MCAAAGMPEEISTPVKPNVSGSMAARGLKAGPPIDQNSKTLPSFAAVVPESPAVPPDDTQARASDATYQLPPAGGQGTIEQQAPQQAGYVEQTLAVTSSDTRGVAGP